jgi:hypothetical protein
MTQFDIDPELVRKAEDEALKADIPEPRNSLDSSPIDNIDGIEILSSRKVDLDDEDNDEFKDGESTQDTTKDVDNNFDAQSPSDISEPL